MLQSWKYLYKTARWKRIRAAQLRKEPLCRYCMRQGKVTLATVADHVLPHKGDHHLFYQGALQSLCHEHHSSSKQSEELRGYQLEIDVHGVPVDPLHPANR